MFFVLAQMNSNTVKPRNTFNYNPILIYRQLATVTNSRNFLSVFTLAHSSQMIYVKLRFIWLALLFTVLLQSLQSRCDDSDECKVSVIHRQNYETLGEKIAHISQSLNSLKLYMDTMIFPTLLDTILYVHYIQ